MQPKELPIGYWIKKADEQLTAGINAIQAAFEVTRTSWQVLNLIKESEPVSEAELISIMQPFADGNSVKDLLKKFRAEHYLREDGKLTLTEKGQELHRACLEQQQNFRQRSMKGISEQEYLTTVSTLKKIADNLST